MNQMKWREQAPNIRFALFKQSWLRVKGTQPIAHLRHKVLSFLVEAIKMRPFHQCHPVTSKTLRTTDLISHISIRESCQMRLYYYRWSETRNFIFHILYRLLPWVRFSRACDSSTAHQCPRPASRLMTPGHCTRRAPQTMIDQLHGDGRKPWQKLMHAMNEHLLTRWSIRFTLPNPLTRDRHRRLVGPRSNHNVLHRSHGMMKDHYKKRYRQWVQKSTSMKSARNSHLLVVNWALLPAVTFPTSA